MSETFELRIIDPDGGERRVYIACSPDDAMRIARLRMTQHGAASVEVWRQGERLATLEPPQTMCA